MTKTWSELGRETAQQEVDRRARVAVEEERDKQTVRPTMTRGEAKMAAIGLMMLKAHEDDGENPEMYRAWSALAKAGGLKR